MITLCDFIKFFILLKYKLNISIYKVFLGGTIFENHIFGGTRVPKG